MTLSLIILSLILYIPADYYNWKYKTVGNIRNSELFKWGMIGCIDIIRGRTWCEVFN